MPVPWDRQPRESSKAFAAFCLYRDLGPQRSVAKAYRLQSGRKQAPVSGTWNLWRAKHQWRKRAEAFDNHLHGQLSAARLQAETELARLRLARQLQSQAAFADLSDRLLSSVARRLPEISFLDEVSPTPGGGKTVKRASSALTLARLLEQLRRLESCLLNGFPAPARERKRNHPDPRTI